MKLSINDISFKIIINSFLNLLILILSFELNQKVLGTRKWNPKTQKILGSRFWVSKFKTFEKLVFIYTI